MGFSSLLFSSLLFSALLFFSLLPFSLFCSALLCSALLSSLPSVFEFLFVYLLLSSPFSPKSNESHHEKCPNSRTKNRNRTQQCSKLKSKKLSNPSPNCSKK